MTKEQKLKTLAVDLPSASHVEVRVTPGKLWINVDGVCLLRIYHVANMVVDLPRSQMAFNRVEAVPGLKQDPSGLLKGEEEGEWRMENLMPGWREKATPPAPTPRKKRKGGNKDEEMVAFAHENYKAEEVPQDPTPPTPTPIPPGTVAHKNEDGTITDLPVKKCLVCGQENCKGSEP